MRYGLTQDRVSTACTSRRHSLPCFLGEKHRLGPLLALAWASLQRHSHSFFSAVDSEVKVQVLVVLTQEMLVVICGWQRSRTRSSQQLSGSYTVEMMRGAS